MAGVCMRQSTGKKFQRRLGKEDRVLRLMSNLNKATVTEACSDFDLACVCEWYHARCRKSKMPQKVWLV